MLSFVTGVRPLKNIIILILPNVAGIANYCYTQNYNNSIVVFDSIPYITFSLADCTKPITLFSLQLTNTCRFEKLNNLERNLPIILFGISVGSHLQQKDTCKNYVSKVRPEVSVCFVDQLDFRDIGQSVPKFRRFPAFGRSSGGHQTLEQLPVRLVIKTRSVFGKSALVVVLIC